MVGIRFSLSKKLFIFTWLILSLFVVSMFFVIHSNFVKSETNIFLVINGVFLLIGGFSFFCAIRVLTKSTQKNNTTELEDRIKSRTIEFEIKNDELEKILEKKTIQLKRLNDHLIYSEEGERKSIASDLHDSVTQTLAMSISKIKNLQDQSIALKSEDLSEIQGYLEQAVREIRSLIYQLSPPILDDFDIDIALGFLIEQINLQHQSDFEYTNNTDDPVPLTPAIKITLYRAVSELITNILKHSGVKEGKINIWNKENIIKIIVEDQGSGFDMNAVKNSEVIGFGLSSLSERMENLGGKITVDSSLSVGTKITLTALIAPDKYN